MNILLVIGSQYPSPGAASRRITNYKKGLDLAGNNTTILSIHAGFRNVFLSHIVSFLQPLIAFYKVISGAKHNDLIFIYGFGFLSKFLILIASKLHNRITLLEFNEYPYSIFGSRRDKYLIFFAPIKRYLLNQLVIPLADNVIVISSLLHEYISKYKSPKARIIYIPILVDYDFFQVDVPMPKCERPYILHSATVNDNKDGISAVLRAIGIINHNNNTSIHLYITLSSTTRDTLRRVNDLINEFNLQGFVHFLGALDELTLLSFQHYSEMVILNKVNSLQNRYNFATRLGEYLALGVPVLATSIGEMSKYLVDKVNYIEIPPNDSNRIAEMINYVVNNPGQSQDIGENGRRLAKAKFDYKNHCQDLSDVVKEQLSSNACLKVRR